MENGLILIIGICFIIIGFMNFLGNISSIHWYHRSKIIEKNKKPYGRCMGIGAGIIGITLIIISICSLLGYEDTGSITIIGIVLGFSFITYGQIKYNKGFF